MSQELLFIVEETFHVGKRLILEPGFSGRHIIPIDAPIVLEFPDGTRHNTRIAGIGMFDPNPKGTYPISLPDIFGKDSVPIGTRVWLTA